MKYVCCLALLPIIFYIGANITYKVYCRKHGIDPKNPEEKISLDDYAVIAIFDFFEFVGELILVGSYIIFR